ncbi:MAG: ribosome maturation factor RimP [Nitrospirae bacterium]|nr:ribosome maturation factor RimP [Nitrospirota bacterium]
MVDTKDLEAKIREIIEPVMNSIGVNLEDIKLAKSGSRFLLRIFIDKEGGVTLDDCERASREIEAQLDVLDPIPSSYILEVSSPGLDRPIKRPGDFKQFTGKTVRVVTSTDINNQTFFIGEIVDAGDADLVLLLPGERLVTIPYGSISKARLEVTV